MTQTLVRQSPLAACHRAAGAQTIDCSGWQVTAHFGDPENEKQQLDATCVLVDWSHLGKLSLRGKAAEEVVLEALGGVGRLQPLESHVYDNQTLLKLADDEYFILHTPDTAVAERFDATRVSRVAQTGAYACLVLAGPRRDEVILRSCAANTRRDRFTPGSVMQTTVHGIGCIYYRSETLDLFLPVRDFAQSLYEAFLDVGRGVGLIRAGLSTLPVKL